MGDQIAYSEKKTPKEDGSKGAKQTRSMHLGKQSLALSDWQSFEPKERNIYIYAPNFNFYGALGLVISDMLLHRITI